MIEQEIRDLIKQYCESINQADVEIAEKFWLTSSKATFIHPKGHEIGWEMIKQNFYLGLMQTMFNERILIPGDITINIFGETAIVEFYWKFDAIFIDGESLHTEGRDSQIFIKDEEKKWRLTHIHYSSMPVIGEREGF